MIFADENARRQLLKEGEVVTFRQHAHSEGRDWATNRQRGKKICDIEVKLICRVDRFKDLIPYVEKSGFKHIWDWAEAIRKFIGDSEFKGYLYKVTKL
jgi:hypothetical protein